MMSLLRNKIALALVVIVCAGTLAYLYFSKTQSSTEQFPEVTSIYDTDGNYGKLTELLNQATTAMNEGDYASAKQTLQSILDTADNDYVREEASVALAHITEEVDPLASIPLYKNIVSNENFNARTRAEALVAMGLLRTTSHVSDTTPFTSAIFSGSVPYTDMRSKSGNIDESYAALFAYANTLFPNVMAGGYSAALNARVLWQQTEQKEITDAEAVVLRSEVTHQISGIQTLLDDPEQEEEHTALNTYAAILSGAAYAYVDSLDSAAVERSVQLFETGLTALVESEQWEKTYLVSEYFRALTDIQTTNSPFVQKSITHLVSYINSQEDSDGVYIRVLNSDPVSVAKLQLLAKTYPEATKLIQ